MGAFSGDVAEVEGKAALDRLAVVASRRIPFHVAKVPTLHRIVEALVTIAEVVAHAKLSTPASEIGTALAIATLRH